jgi:Rha family phage regulatory protein
MNQLLEKPVAQTLDSREVAEMVEKQHSELLKDIRRYITQGAEGNIHLGEFFQESSYKDANNQERPCYLVTRKGCEFIANKLTGIKGTEFTAKYINRFHDMEQTIKTGLDISQLSPELQMFKQIFDSVAKTQLAQKEQEKAIEDTNKRIDNIKDVVALNPNDWRKDTSKLINKMALKAGGYEHLNVIREESYKLLDERFGVALSIRLTNMKKTMSLNGVCKSKIDKLNKLDVIANDKKLIEGYVAIVKDMCIRYGVDQAS